ncbi:hypothetical protein [Paractinoplanes toevensis]|uniref:Uncharacterized protein n=1 Tax=Paractinoplanes toevensis TaxID=571911 RepID=A0A919T6G0_9ACTN|nr:hypothetical protein [Actinoplanes toevensis]GIM88735.1 hypothetical protein Ato02nite_005280 [Actinoplanes toevensis]
MTATQRPRLKTDVRWGRVYGWDVIDHASWMAGTNIVFLNDYVGQTRQKGRARENQHRDSQPWSDLTVGSPRTLWEGWCTDEQLDEMERHFIQDVPFEQRPRLNYVLNENNSRHIPKWDLEDQRRQRDALRGDEPWEPTPYRPETYGYAPAARVKARRPWRPWQKQLLAAGALSLALTVGVWIALHRLGMLQGDAWWQTAAGTAVFAGWVWAGFPGLTRRSRRRAQRVRRRWRRWL